MVTVVQVVQADQAVLVDQVVQADQVVQVVVQAHQLVYLVQLDI